VIARLVPVALFVLLAALLLVGLRVAEDKEKIPSPLIGKPAPNFTLPTLHGGGELSGTDLLGEPYLLNVWASWCPGCRVEHEQIAHIAQSGEIPVYGLNYKDAPGDARRWLERYGDPYKAILQDLDGQVGIDFGVYGAPETFLIDARGIVRYKYIGPLQPSTWTEEIRPLVRRLVSEPS